MVRYLNNKYIGGRVISRPRMRGTGALLLRNGIRGGPASNFSSLSEYEHAQMQGNGLMQDLNRLTVKPLVKKMRNIRF